MKSLVFSTVLQPRRLSPVTHRLIPDEHYREFELSDMRALRNERGSARYSTYEPSKGITSAEDLKDPAKTARLQSVYQR